MAKKETVSGNIFDGALLKRVIGLAKPYRKQFIIASILAVVVAVVTPIRPYLIKIAVDDHIMKFDIEGLKFIVYLLLATLVVEFILRYYFIYLTRWLGQYVIKDLRVRVFNHVINLKLKYFDRTPIGTSTTRTINDVETINEIFSQGIITIFADLLTLFAVIVIMFITDWRLAIVSLVTLPLIFYATYVFKERIKGAFQIVRAQVSKMNAFLQEHISGMRIVQIFNAEKIEMKKFKDINKEHRDAYIKSIFYFSIFFPLVEIILAMAIGLMVWYGATLVVGAQIQIGVIMAFILYLNMLFRPLRMLADKFNTLQMGFVASERVFDLLDRKDFIVDEGRTDLASVGSKIRFKDVSFAYIDEDFVLKNVDFEVGEGKTLALVGATGSGKTSIINILSRFYEYQQGEIFIDDIEIRDIPLPALRKSMAVVLQDVFLFSGTIMDNITLRNESIDREKVIEASKIVGAHRFIMNLPGGYDYNVMERGVTLSVGQRQLISFIRALVVDPPILILDEATSSIDTESELIIQNAIEKLVKNRTSIVIAHRLSTIQNADMIIVLDNGRIKEQGTHEELLELDGYYKNLYDMQFKKHEARA
ncbi:MAG: ABC transporter ATP-binding protein [Chitinophagales bacterium]|nr:ABC transporter ATP-binding protein [Chitinophagales bacterium]